MPCWVYTRFCLLEHLSNLMPWDSGVFFYPAVLMVIMVPGAVSSSKPQRSGLGRSLSDAKLTIAKIPCYFMHLKKGYNHIENHL